MSEERASPNQLNLDIAQEPRRTPHWAYGMWCTGRKITVKRKCMQINACKNQIGAASAIDEVYPSVDLAIAALAANNKLESLASIARKRLERLARQSYGQRLRGSNDPVELVNQAVELVLSGKRRARPQNLVGLPAFMNYMQGVLQSVITHELERVVRQGETVSVETMADGPLEGTQLQAPNDVVKEVILNENEAAIRAELEGHADQQAEIDAVLGVTVVPKWTPGCEAPRVVRRRIHRLRRRARKILLRQAAEAGISSPTPLDAVNL